MKHKEVLAVINTGVEFSCKYVKGTGELTEFINAKKHVKAAESMDEQAAAADTTKRRVATQYESLIPIETASGEIREIYSRCIVEFNGVEVLL